MSSTSMTSHLVTSSEADGAILMTLRLPFPFQPLSPVVDFVAGLHLSMFTKSVVGFLGVAVLLLIMARIASVTIRLASACRRTRRLAVDSGAHSHALSP